MKITKETVEHLAGLSKLKFSEKEVDGFIHDFQNIVNFVEQLKEVDTEGVEPLHYVYEPEQSVLREDVVKQEITKQQALLNAAKKDSDYFKVPTVINE